MEDASRMVEVAGSAPDAADPESIGIVPEADAAWLADDAALPIALPAADVISLVALLAAEAVSRAIEPVAEAASRVVGSAADAAFGMAAPAPPPEPALDAASCADALMAEPALLADVPIEEAVSRVVVPAADAASLTALAADAAAAADVGPIGLTAVADEDIAEAAGAVGVGVATTAGAGAGMGLVGVTTGSGAGAGSSFLPQAASAIPMMESTAICRATAWGREDDMVRTPVVVGECMFEKTRVIHARAGTVNQLTAWGPNRQFESGKHSAGVGCVPLATRSRS